MWSSYVDEMEKICSGKEDWADVAEADIRRGVRKAHRRVWDSAAAGVGDAVGSQVHRVASDRLGAIADRFMTPKAPKGLDPRWGTLALATAPLALAGYAIHRDKKDSTSRKYPGL